MRLLRRLVYVTSDAGDGGPPLDDRQVLRVGTILGDDYRVLRVLGSGGFGITYEAIDLKLGITVAIKEYYPFEFGERACTMNVRPKSERHKAPFSKGRTDFLQEARTVAQVENPNIVRITRVFEANSTAYMVMRFERGQSFENWLDSLGRRPRQEELDAIVRPLLDALQVIHNANLLHRDIAPDNVLVRADGSPVLLDFGAARRAIAEMSGKLTGIVKPGYSPHEQYTSDSRLQGPWSDLFALGGTLYRAVTGAVPEDVALRVDSDRMPPASRVAKGIYRSNFLAGIDACLKVKYAERPQSVAQLRPMLLGLEPRSGGLTKPATGMPSSVLIVAASAAFVLIAGAYAGFVFTRWSTHPSVEADRRLESLPSEPKGVADDERRRRDAEAKQRFEAEATRKAELDAQAKAAAEAEARRRFEAEAARKAELDAQAKAAAGAEARRQEEARIAAEKRAFEERARLEAARKYALRLVKMGDDQIKEGNVAAARLFYERAAEAGLAEAAMALAATFDPVELARRNLTDVASDPKQARRWYERARELGAVGADIPLKRLSPM